MPSFPPYLTMEMAYTFFYFQMYIILVAVFVTVQFFSTTALTDSKCIQRYSCIHAFNDLNLSQKNAFIENLIFLQYDS